MIKAIDLRIGNWVDANTPEMQVRAITEYEVELYMPDSEADNFTYEVDKLEGILLTPEVIGRCSGCLVLEGTGYYVHKIGNIEISIRPEDGTVYIQDKRFPILMDKKVKYLHEFQNLVYTVTGKEIEYKALNTNKP